MTRISDDEFSFLLDDPLMTIPDIPREGRNISHFFPKIHERQFPRLMGFPFAIVFAYPQPDAPGSMGSPMVYTGDLGTIRDALIDEPTHHGFVLNYRRGVMVSKPQGNSVILLGKYSYQYRHSSNSLILDYVTPNDTSYRRHIIGQMKRAGFYLLFRQRCQRGVEEKVLHKWRRLPKTYLKQLGEADEYLDKYLKSVQ